MKPLEGKRIACIVHDYYENVELTDPRDSLIAMGADVDVITAADSKQLHGLDHVELSAELTADYMLADVDPADYDAVILPGGTVNADQLRAVESAREFVATIYEAGKPVAAICHAPWVLISAGLVEDKQITSFPTLRDDVVNAGATWKDETVVVDGNIITSRNPSDIPAFTEAIVGALQA